MASAYRTFYVVENRLRGFIAAKLQARFTTNDWLDHGLPKEVDAKIRRFSAHERTGWDEGVTYPPLA